jgi:hypothetical protein
VSRVPVVVVVVVVGLPVVVVVEVVVVRFGNQASNHRKLIGHLIMSQQSADRCA